MHIFSRHFSRKEVYLARLLWSFEMRFFILRTMPEFTLKQLFCWHPCNPKYQHGWKSLPIVARMHCKSVDAKYSDSSSRVSWHRNGDIPEIFAERLEITKYEPCSSTGCSGLCTRDASRERRRLIVGWDRWWGDYGLKVTSWSSISGLEPKERESTKEYAERLMATAKG